MYSIYYSTKNHKISGNKPNQKSKGSVLKELHNTHEKIEEDTKRGRRFHTLGSEE